VANDETPWIIGALALALVVEAVKTFSSGSLHKQKFLWFH